MLFQNTKPLVLKLFMKLTEQGPTPDIIVTGNKLATLVEYWEDNFYAKGNKHILGKRYMRDIESLIVSLSK